MNLVLDIGNTRTKGGLFDGKTLVEHFYFDKNPLGQIKQLLAGHPEIKFSLVSSVLNHSKELTNSLRSRTNCIEFNADTRLPIKIAYKSPETLGKDRIAAAIGAYTLFKGHPTLSVDAGTCIKFDFVTAEGEYLGGSIAPGVEMRLKALNTFTDKLPLVSVNAAYTALIGTSTGESILSGVQNGALYEVKGFMEAYKKQYPGLKTVISGGDAPFFENALKNSIFADPNLVLTGLNEILNFNVSRLA